MSKRNKQRPQAVPVKTTGHELTPGQIVRLDLAHIAPGVHPNGDFVVMITGSDSFALKEATDKTGEPYYWPEGKPMPTSIVKPKPVPCPECRRVRLDTMSPACIVRTSNGGVSYLRCRVCGHLFKMSVKVQ